MRASVDKTDPGWRADAYNYQVFLNGVELKNCVTADEEEGMVVVYVRDKEGGLAIRNGRIKSEVLYGTVEIVERPYLTP